MSVYSGFSTRYNEQQYNKQLVNLIKVLQRRVIKFYMNEPADENVFKQVFGQIYTKLNGMEDSKYIEPYYGQYLQELCNYLQIDFKSSNKSSVLSQNIPKCNCKCHHITSAKAVDREAFLTHVDMSKDKIVLQPINGSQRGIISKISFDSGGQYHSVTRPQSKTPSRNYQPQDRLSSGRLGRRNVSLELNQYASTQQQFSSTMNNRKPPRQGTNRSPYYSTVYSLNGQNYNKVEAQKKTAHRQTSPKVFYKQYRKHSNSDKPPQEVKRVDQRQQNKVKQQSRLSHTQDSPPQRAPQIEESAQDNE